MQKTNGCTFSFCNSYFGVFGRRKKLLNAKGPFSGNVFRYIFLLFYCFARSVELCEIVYSNVVRPKCVRVSLYLQASLSI